jgi:hypothetical protein
MIPDRSVTFQPLRPISFATCSSTLYTEEVDKQFEHDLPSHHRKLLEQLVGGTIQRFTRFLYDRVEEIPEGYAIAPEKVFGDFSAPLLLELADGLTLGFDVEPRESSLMVWTERARDGQIREGASLLASDSLSPLECTDQRFSDPQLAWMVGRAIASVSILVRQPQSLRDGLRAREAGIVLSLRCGRECILLCGLRDAEGDFSVVFREDIPADLLLQLKEERLPPS